MTETNGATKPEKPKRGAPAAPRAPMSTELERARQLYLNIATRPELEELRVCEEHAERTVDKDARARAQARLPDRKRALTRAQREAGEFFDAVIRGEREP